jgi:hypothetical protein
MLWSRHTLFLLASTNYPHRLLYSTPFQRFLVPTDRQERQLSHASSEDRVKVPSEGAYICVCLCHIRIQKSRYRIEIGI